ncbi:MAG: hypothetical protein HY801_01675 [Candidatus Lindowbacteria bacterium]|nr:hypothetical protein [Candidatus Lindowbacteria bacterium]
MIESSGKRFSFVLTLLALIICFSNPAWGKAEKDAIAEIKLAPASLPQGMTITRETRASQQQLLNARIRLGFPLIALVNQTLARGEERAKVNYMLPVGEEWFDFGYSKLVATDGTKSLVMTKSGVIVQLAATTKDLEDELARLLAPDSLHLLKIKVRDLPEDWIFTGERYLPHQELAALERKVGGQIQSALFQEFMVSREKVKMKYYNCGSQKSAEDTRRHIANERNLYVSQNVKVSGATVVVAECQDDRVSEEALSLINW